MTVHNAEEKAAMSEMIEKLNAHLEVVGKNLEVQVADNAQLSRYVWQLDDAWRIIYRTVCNCGYSNLKTVIILF